MHIFDHEKDAKDLKAEVQQWKVTARLSTCARAPFKLMPLHMSLRMHMLCTCLCHACLTVEGVNMPRHMAIRMSIHKLKHMGLHMPMCKSAHIPVSMPMHMRTHMFVLHVSDLWRGVLV